MRVPAPDSRLARNHRVADDLDAVAQNDLAPDHRIRADLDAVAERRSIFDDGRGVDLAFSHSLVPRERALRWNLPAWR